MYGEVRPHWSAQEIHRIAINGINMSGMPAFGEHHDAEELVALTAFVRALAAQAR